VLLIAAVGTLERLLHWPAWPVVASLVLVPVAALLAEDRYRSLGHAVVDGYLVTGHGSLVRHRAVLHRRSVIGWNLRSTWLQRRAGLVTLTATTAAARQGYEVYDVDAREGLTLAEAITPGLLDQFRSGR